MMTSNLTSQQLKFAELLANPEEKRTLAEIAEELGVRRETLSRWKQLEGFSKMVCAISVTFVGAELPKVFGAMLRSAQSGNVPAARLLLEASGVIKSSGQLQAMANSVASEAECQEERERQEQEQIRQACAAYTPEQIAMLREAQSIARRIHLVDLSEPTDEVAIDSFAEVTLSWLVTRWDFIPIRESVSLAFETLRIGRIENIRTVEDVKVRNVQPWS